MNAEEAYKISRSVIDKVDLSKEVAFCLERIKESCERGRVSAIIDCLGERNILDANKNKIPLVCEKLRELGYKVKFITIPIPYKNELHSAKIYIKWSDDTDLRFDQIVL